MTNKIKAYSTTPGSNNAASPDGWPEDMAPSRVNNSDREFAARVREWYEDSQWIDYGDTIVSSTTLTVSISGDVTGRYVANRAIRAGQSDSEIGFVVASAYSAPNTSITVSGLDLSGVSQIELGATKDYEVMPHLAKFRATQTSVQTIATGSLTVVSFNNEDFDTASIYDTSTYRMTATTATAGYYDVGWGVNTDVPVAVGPFACSLYKNGSLYIGGTVTGQVGGTPSTGMSSHGRSMILLSAGDYIDIRALQLTGSNLPTQGLSTGAFFEARRIV